MRSLQREGVKKGRDVFEDLRVENSDDVERGLATKTLA